MTKRETLLIRLSPEEKEGFELASKIAGISTSAWIRERLRLATIRELENAGLKVPFVQAIK